MWPQLVYSGFENIIDTQYMCNEYIKRISQLLILILFMNAPTIYSVYSSDIVYSISYSMFQVYYTKYISLHYIRIPNNSLLIINIFTYL